MPTTLVDSSALIAAANPSDANHAALAAALRAEDDLATPVTILAETMSFIRARRGGASQRQFWTGFMSSDIDVIEVNTELLSVALEIDSRYEDVDFGFADSVLLATCERLKCARILTLDARLGLYRPSFAGHLDLLP